MRRRLAALELQHLGRLRLDAEIERELTAARREQIAQHGAEAARPRELRIGLADDREVGKREERLAVVAMRGRMSPHFCM